MFVFNNRDDSQCFDIIFEFSKESLATHIEKSPLVDSDFLNLIDKMIQTGLEKEEKLEHFINIDPKWIFEINNDFKFCNPYMSESYLANVVTIYWLPKSKKVF